MLNPPIRKILLVEDDEQGVIPAELFFDEDTWEPEGTLPPELLVARTGEDFERLVREHGSTLEAIVTDIALSDDPTNSSLESGVDCYTRLRDYVSGVPCLAITGQAPDSEAIKALKSGMVDYIKKPFSWNQVWNQIQKKVAVVRLERSTRQFKSAISEIVGSLTAIENLKRPGLNQELVRKIVEIAVLACQAQGGWLFLAPSGQLEYEVGVGFPSPGELPARGLFNDVYQTGMEQCFYLTGEQDVSSLASFEADKGALLAVPLMGPSGCLGILEIARKRGDQAFTPDQVSLMNQFAIMAGVTVEAHRRDINASELLVRTLQKALEHRGELDVSESMESLESQTLDQAESSDSQSLISSLNTIKGAGPGHLAFWKRTLESYCESLTEL